MEMFLAYVEQNLTRDLRKGDVRGGRANLDRAISGFSA